MYSGCDVIGQFRVLFMFCDVTVSMIVIEAMMMMMMMMMMMIPVFRERTVVKIMFTKSCEWKIIVFMIFPEDFLQNTADDIVLKNAVKFEHLCFRRSARGGCR